MVAVVHLHVNAVQTVREEDVRAEAATEELHVVERAEVVRSVRHAGGKIFV